MREPFSVDGREAMSAVASVRRAEHAATSSNSSSDGMYLPLLCRIMAETASASAGLQGLRITPPLPRSNQFVLFNA
jgi:hypothetical protein